MLALSGNSRSGTELELLIGRQIAGISALSIIERVAVRCQQKSVDRRRIGTIDRLMYRIHIGTIIVYIGSSTVLATGLFGWQCNASNGVIFIGKSARNLVGRSYTYRRDPYRNSRYSGAISLSIVYSSTVLA